MRYPVFDGYRPHPGQLKFHRLNKRFGVLLAGARSGKTFGAARDFLHRIYADRGHDRTNRLHYWCVAPTYGIGKVQMRELFSALGGVSGKYIKAWHKTERELWLRDEILIEFKTAERPEALVAVGLNGMWIDEAARMKSEAWLGGLRMRLSDKRGWAIFSTTPLGRNWFYHEVVRRAQNDGPLADPEYGMVRFHTVDNTAVPGLVEEVEHARRTLPPRYFRREYEADLTGFAGMIFEEFDPDLHVLGAENRLSILRPPTQFAEVRAGVDWGYRNPGAIVVLGRDGDGVWWVLAEHVEKALPVMTSGGRDWTGVAKTLKAEYGIRRFACDPSGASFIAAFRRAGLPAFAADNDVGAGIQAVATALHVDESDRRPGLLIAQSCPHLVDELSSYAWDDRAEGERPRKEDDHAVDALRYALHAKQHTPAFW